MSPLFDDAEVRALISGWADEAMSDGAAKEWEALHRTLIALEAEDDEAFERALAKRYHPLESQGYEVLGRFTYPPDADHIRRRFGARVIQYAGEWVVARRLILPGYLSHQPINPYYAAIRAYHNGTALPY